MAALRWRGPTLFILLVLGVCAVILAHFYIKNKSLPREPKQDSSKPLVVWPMNAYVPNMTAGGEITCHETNKQLIADGINVTVIVKNWVVPGQDGVRILASEDNTYDAKPEAVEAFKRASAICIQNLDMSYGMSLCRKYRKPAVFFIHATSVGKEFLGYAGGWPTFVVYNSWSMKADIAANYKSYIVKPWIDMRRFLKISGANDMNSKHYVTLINLNKSKGGQLLVDLAKEMPDVQFLGVEGGYGDQVRDTSLRNLTYMSKTDKIEEVYKKSKIVIMPSDLETWGRVAIEAMAASTPVIINDVEGMREATGGAALVARRDDIGEWKRAIRSLLNDPLFYKEQVDKGLRRCQELDDNSDMKGLADWMRQHVFTATPSGLI
jgi:glycosyltransferase involved in cell wall biosynthesis